MKQLTFKDIPRGTERDGWTDTIEAGAGYSVRVKVECGERNEAPWDNEDGHGPVSEWRSKDSKAPGEMVLAEDRGHCLFYDFAAAVRLARKDRWDSPPYKTGTPGERAHRAAMADFERMRRFAAGDWQYIGVTVEVSRAGDVAADDSLWGIESDGDYWREHAADTANWIIAADVASRKAADKIKAAATRERARLFRLNPVSVEV